jgi:hypothetical protein
MLLANPNPAQALVKVVGEDKANMLGSLAMARRLGREKPDVLNEEEGELHVFLSQSGA